jgi:hypothetical protein
LGCDFAAKARRLNRGLYNKRLNNVQQTFDSQNDLNKIIEIILTNLYIGKSLLDVG